MSRWSSNSNEGWQAALDGYQQTVAGLGRSSKGGKSLGELDRWFHEELPAALSKRKPAKMKHDELVRLVDWKLTRGKWRPRLLQFAQDLPPASAEAATQAAFDLLAAHPGGDAPPEVIKEALDALTVLKGIGPATATAILEAFDPSIPFLSDEAQQAALGSKDYTVKAVQQLTAALRKKAAQLSEGGGRQWTAKEVEQCLFASSMGSDGGGSGKGGSSKGAKRSGAAAPAAPAQRASDAEAAAGSSGKKRRR